MLAGCPGCRPGSRRPSPCRDRARARAARPSRTRRRAGSRTSQPLGVAAGQRAGEAVLGAVARHRARPSAPSGAVTVPALGVTAKLAFADVERDSPAGPRDRRAARPSDPPGRRSSARRSPPGKHLDRLPADPVGEASSVSSRRPRRRGASARGSRLPPGQRRGPPARAGTRAPLRAGAGSAPRPRPGLESPSATSSPSRSATSPARSALRSRRRCRRRSADAQLEGRDLRQVEDVVDTLPGLRRSETPASWLVGSSPAGAPPPPGRRQSATAAAPPPGRGGAGAMSAGPHRSASRAAARRGRGRG